MQSSSEPTPGPWILRTFGQAVYVMDSIPDDNGRCVANIIAAPNTNPAWEANARLIAAAPDLLAACKKLLRRLEAKEGLLVAYRTGARSAPEKHLDTCRETKDAEDEAKAAIASAEGKVPHA